MTCILVVDDDKEIVRLVQSYLERSGMTVLPAYDGEQALCLLRHERPDLVLLDLMLPKLDGWEITRWMRADSLLSEIPILMLTARGQDSDKILGLELGADDYLTKPFNPGELMARVRAILRRMNRSGSSPRVLVQSDICLDLESRSATVRGQPVVLTRTEFALLRILMASPNRAFTRAELIEQAFGYAYEGMERSLDTHIKNLRKKVEPDPSEPRHIQTVFGVGYRWQSESEKDE
ncbi:MAG: response regulator transcription factor [Chloroflexi bacterium]|nr:response regulator transcription factor [Chloroflexota bacterium]